MKRNSVLPAFLLSAVPLVVIGLVMITACSERDVRNVQDDDEILRYLRQVPTAQELFATDGLVTGSPYYKSSEPGVEYRDILDSVTRQITQFLTPDSVEKDHGAPFALADDAEVRIIDEFHIRVQRVEGIDTTWVPETRYLTRWGYFLRIVDGGVYSGWVLHGVNLSQARGGDEALGMDVYIQPDGYPRIDGDGFHYEQFTYLKIIYGRIYDPKGDSLYIGVDTVAGRSMQPYMLVSEIPEVGRGSELVVTALNVPYTIPDASVQLRISYLSDTGWVTSSADRIDNDVYLDTLQFSGTTSRNFNMIWFYETRYPDRFGGLWGVPFRAVN